MIVFATPCCCLLLCFLGACYCFLRYFKNARRKKSILQQKDIVQLVAPPQSMVKAKPQSLEAELHAEALSKLKCELATSRAEFIALKKSSEGKIKSLRYELNMAKVDSRDNSLMNDIMQTQNRLVVQKRDEVSKLLMDSDAKKKALEVTVLQLEKRLADIEDEHSMLVPKLKNQLKAANEEKEEISKERKEYAQQVSESRLKIDSMAKELEQLQEKLNTQRVNFDELHQGLKRRNDALCSTVEALTKERICISAKLSAAEKDISKLETELSNNSKEAKVTAEMKLMKLEHTVKCKENYISQIRSSMKDLIGELSKMSSSSKEYAVGAKGKSVTIQPNIETFEDDLLCTLREKIYEVLKHNKELSGISAKLIENNELTTTQENSENQGTVFRSKDNGLQTQLSITAEKLASLRNELSDSRNEVIKLEKLRNSENLESFKKLQEVQKMLAVKDEEIALLADISRTLKDELISVRAELSEKDSKILLFEEAVIEKDEATHNLLSKHSEMSTELSCATTKCSRLQRELADAVQEIEYTKATAASQLQESSDALNRKEQEVQLLTKEFGTIQSELFSVMEQLNAEMKDLQGNISTLRDISNVKDKIIEELQTEKNARLHHEQLNSIQNCLLFDLVTLPSAKSDIEESHDLSEADSESAAIAVPYECDVEHRAIAKPNDENSTVASNTDESTDLVDLADLFFGIGTSSLLRTPRKIAD